MNSRRNFGSITAQGVLYRHPYLPPFRLFWEDPKGHENFWCSVAGGTSGSSSSPRTEMRETLPDSDISYNWAVGGATHRMAGTVRVEVVPSSEKVIVGQIHAHGASNPFLMVTWWKGEARIDLRSDPKGDARKVLHVPCPLGKAFKYSLEVDPSGLLTMNLNGQILHELVSPEWNRYPFYFKRGAYVIDHEGPEYEGGWVVYEESYLSHELAR